MSLRMTEQEYADFLQGRQKTKKPNTTANKQPRDREAKGVKKKKDPKNIPEYDIKLIDCKIIKPEFTVKESIRFHLPLDITGELGLNKIYAGVHWSVRKRESEKMHDYIHLELRRQKIQKHIFKKPVRINIFYNTNMDVDNHGYASKLIIDGLKGYFIEDDNRKYVVGKSEDFWDGEGVLVEIKEV